MPTFPSGDRQLSTLTVYLVERIHGFRAKRRREEVERATLTRAPTHRLLFIIPRMFQVMSPGCVLKLLSQALTEMPLLPTRRATSTYARPRFPLSHSSQTRHAVPSRRSEPRRIP